MKQKHADNSYGPAEAAALRMVQGDLPDCAEPYAEIARQAGLTEAEALELLQRLKDQGVIRRFGATLRHQQAGYGDNAMVAWYVEQDLDLDQVGALMASRPEISHCYQRRNCYEWPFNLYTMVHARSRQECLDLVEELSKVSRVPQYAILFSRIELKKTSMAYF